MNSQAPATLDPAQLARAQQQLQLEARFRNGINWFYWIAGLSLINSVAFLAGATFAFVIGLGATQVADYIVSDVAKGMGSNATLIRLVGFVLDLAFAGIFVIFGVLGRARKRAAIIVGMVLYALDAVLLVALQDWLGAAFHAWALFGIFGGLRALGQLQALQRPAGSDVIQTLD